MGIRMTRDLQRNLDLMKEIAQEKGDANQEKFNGTTSAKTLDDVLSNALERIQHHEVENQNNDGMNNKDNETEDSYEKIGTMEISFEDAGHNHGHDDDDIFASLVGNPSVVDLTTDYSVSLKQSFDSDSAFEWEEGVIEDKRNIVPSHFHAETKLSFMDEGTSNDVDVEWEEGFQGIQMNSSSFPDEIPQTVRNGALVEEAGFQETIRRSLDDLIDDRALNSPCEDQELGRSEKMVDGDSTWRSVLEAKGPQIECPARNTIQPIESTQPYDIAEQILTKAKAVKIKSF